MSSMHNMNTSGVNSVLGHVNNATGASNDVFVYDEVVGQFADFIEVLDNYVQLVIIIIGLLGNTLSFIVFKSSKLRHLSSSIYLAALAASDNGFLVCLLVSWSSNIGIQLYNRQGWCQFFTYATYVFSFLSVWYVVAFSIERYIVICWPLKRMAFCSRKRATAAVISFAAFACVFYNFALWTSSVVEMPYGWHCSPLEGYYDVITQFNNVDTFMTLVLPLIMITCLNIRIITAVINIQKDDAISSQHTSSRVVRRRSNRRDDSESSQHKKLITVVSGRPRHSAVQMKLTSMAIVIITVFLILNLPCHLVRLYVFIASELIPNFHPSHLLFLTQRFFMYIYFLNFAVNFPLYALCGKNFRQALIHNFNLCWRKMRWKDRAIRLTNMAVPSSARNDSVRFNVKPTSQTSSHCNNSVS